MTLSDRLESIIALVSPGRVLADIGCDHGFISIELVSRGISPEVIASDLREGPLEKAVSNVRSAGLEDKISFRISNGFDAYKEGEVRTAVIAGMGGVLIRDILTAGLDKVKLMDDLVVQPQSNIPEFRLFLRTSGFTILKNVIVKDSGKYYFPMKIRYTGGTLAEGADDITADDRYGADLIKEDRGLSEYLEYEMDSYRKIYERLITFEGEHAERSVEIKELMDLNRKIYDSLNNK